MRRPLMVLFVTVACGVVLAACDWPSWRYDSANTGYNSTESIISTSNVSQLVSHFTVPAPPATDASALPSTSIIANGDAYVATQESAPCPLCTTNGFLSAYNASNGTLLWTSPNFGSVGQPAVSNGFVYASAGSVDVFDAAGSTSCSGTPKVCQPLWTYDVGVGLSATTPVIVNGVLYVTANASPSPLGAPPTMLNRLFAFDAAGKTNCSGTPKVCEPLWVGPPTAAAYGVPAVSNGVLYVGNGAILQAFNASGSSTNCLGTPTVVCQPLWSGQGVNPVDTPTVANGAVFMSGGAGVVAFDAAGTTNCSGSPVVCQPLRTYATGDPVSADLAVANGVLYASPNGSTRPDGLAAFDATGTTNCSGISSPVICKPLWTTQPPISANAESSFGAPSVANGVVYVTAFGGPDAYAFDAAGNLNCSGTPTVCTNLWHAATSGKPSSLGDPSIANGLVYITEVIPSSITSGGSTVPALQAFGLPPAPPPQ